MVPGTSQTDPKDYYYGVRKTTFHYIIGLTNPPGTLVGALIRSSKPKFVSVDGSLFFRTRRNSVQGFVTNCWTTSLSATQSLGFGTQGQDREMTVRPTRVCRCDKGRPFFPGTRLGTTFREGRESST